MTKNWKKIDGKVSIDVLVRHRNHFWWETSIEIDYRKKFDNLDSALRWNYYKGAREFPTNTVYDEQDIAIPLAVLNTYYGHLKYEYSKQPSLPRFGCPWSRLKYKFRSGPVPGISNLNRWSSCFRYPKTASEYRKQSEFDDISREVKADYGIILKGRKRFLRNSWDDIYQTREKNWKSQRKTQYKMKE